MVIIASTQRHTRGVPKFSPPASNSHCTQTWRPCNKCSLADHSWPSSPRRPSPAHSLTSKPLSLPVTMSHSLPFPPWWPPLAPNGLPSPSPLHTSCWYLSLSINGRWISSIKTLDSIKHVSCGQTKIGRKKVLLFFLCPLCVFLVLF